MHTTPPSLLQRLRDSPAREAWERFIDMYTPLFYTWARRLHLDDHETADLVQDLFAVLLEELPRFRYDGTRSFRAWVKTVMLNRWRNHQRRRAAAPALAADLDWLAEEGAPIPELEETEHRNYVVARALSLMRAEFPETIWKACWEFVVSERPADAVAQELGISVNSVYLAKSRVLRRLREELAGFLE